MGEVFDRLRASAGERGLFNALGRWRQRVSQLLDSSGGIVELAHTQLNQDLNIPVGGALVTLVTSPTFTLDGAARPKTALIRAGVNGRLGTGDTSVIVALQLQVSVNGAPFAALKTWSMGTVEDDTAYRCSTFEMTQPILINATAAYQLAIAVAGTPTDVFTIDALNSTGFAYLTVQISNDPE